MNILLLGSGGREHALAWKLHQSVPTNPLYIAPGNAGTAMCGNNVDISLNDFDGISKFCIDRKIEMIVVGPEEPLVNGLYDFFKSNDVLKEIFFIGPSKFGAQLEGSKAFAKEFMLRHDIPTAAYREFDASSYEEGVQFIQQQSLPVVLKADGLAAGKGVIIAYSHLEAIAEFELMIHQEKFGEASRKVVVEQFLDGIELSVFALTDGLNYVLLPEAKDYKRIGTGDTGLNTGGMGAVSPVPFATASFMEKVERRIIIPTMEGLKKESIDYKGFIFFGLIKVGDDPFIIEYNCRLGDPETEVVIPRLENDLVELFIATSQQRLQEVQINVDRRKAVTIVATSRGYPGSYDKGFVIEGLRNKPDEDCLIFHAGTREEKGRIVTNGGRVLCVTALGNDLEQSLHKSLNQLSSIDFDGIYYRKDIGYEFLNANDANK